TRNSAAASASSKSSSPASAEPSRRPPSTRWKQSGRTQRRLIKPPYPLILLIFHADGHSSIACDLRSHRGCGAQRQHHASVITVHAPRDRAVPVEPVDHAKLVGRQDNLNLLHVACDARFDRRQKFRNAFACEG